MNCESCGLPVGYYYELRVSFGKKGVYTYYCQMCAKGGAVDASPSQ